MKPTFTSRSSNSTIHFVEFSSAMNKIIINVKSDDDITDLQFEIDKSKFLVMIGVLKDL